MGSIVPQVEGRAWSNEVELAARRIIAGKPLDGDAAIMRDEVARQVKRVADLESALAAERSRASGFQQDLDCVREDADSFRRDREALRADWIKACDERDAERSRVNEAERERDKERDELYQRDIGLVAIRAELFDATKQVSELMGELGDARASLETRDAEVTRLAEERDKLADAIGSMARDGVDLEAEVTRLRKALEKVTRMACPGRGYSFQDIRKLALDGLATHGATAPAVPLNPYLLPATSHTSAHPTPVDGCPYCPAAPAVPEPKEMP